MSMNKRTLILSLAGGGISVLSACGPQIDKTDAQFGDGTKVEAVANTGSDPWSPIEASIHVTIDPKNFTIKEPTAASQATPPGLYDDAWSTYNAGCTDTISATDEVLPDGYFKQLWSPYNCPGPDEGGSQTMADWNAEGHVHVYLNGVFVGEGYSNDFELKVLQQKLYTVPTDLDGDGLAVIDHDGYMVPWSDLWYYFYTGDPNSLDLSNDKNGDGLVDVGQDLDQDGVIRGSEAVETDTNGDGDFDYINEDYDGDGKLDVYVYDLAGDGYSSSAGDVRGEDFDKDKHMDVNEDRADTGNGDGIPGIDLMGVTVNGKTFAGHKYVVSADVDCDGHLDVNEDTNGNGAMDCGEDVDGDGRLDGIDIDGDGIADAGEADLAAAGVATTGPDKDLDSDCRIDGFKYVGGTLYEAFTASEDQDGDGFLDKYEDIDFDGILDTSEDTDGDGIWDSEDESSITPQCADHPYGCEGDEVYILRSGDLLLDAGALGAGDYRLAGEYGTDWNDDTCSAAHNLINFITIKFVHDDHSEVYGTPVFTYQMTDADLDTMGLLPADTNPLTVRNPALKNIRRPDVSRFRNLK